MYEATIPEYSSYGVLMPVLGERRNTANDVLSKEEIIWSQAIVDFYNNKNIRAKYLEKSGERARCFDVEFIIPQWKKLLNN
jgi:hypothetical protein